MKLDQAPLAVCGQLGGSVRVHAAGPNERADAQGLVHPSKCRHGGTCSELVVGNPRIKGAAIRGDALSAKTSPEKTGCPQLATAVAAIIEPLLAVLSATREQLAGYERIVRRRGKPSRLRGA
jgi:hypothetical protein